VIGLAHLLARVSDAPLFVRPLPLWDYWVWLLVPLSLGVAIVYKSVKCRTMDQVPREAAVLTFWILAVMVAVAAALAGLVYLLER
jgi:hypothetical protein